AHAEGVEGRDQWRLGDSARRLEQSRHAVAHFLGGLIGEGDGENLARPHAVIQNEVRNAVRDDAGLAAAGAGQDEERTFGVLDGLALPGIELCEEIHSERRAEPLHSSTQQSEVLGAAGWRKLGLFSALRYWSRPPWPRLATSPATTR